MFIIKSFNHKSRLLVVLSSLLVLTACNGSSDNEPKVNTAPSATSQSVTTSADTALMARLIGSDAEGDRLRFTANMPPQNGRVEIAADGAFTYTPNTEYVGTDSFTFTVSDGLLSATGTITVVINALQVSFRSLVRESYAQTAQSMPLAVNGREISQDVLDTAEFDDLVVSGTVANND
ncbi:Ig-like domain-containing protein [Rheinheimera salexigens]|uniref:Cadherin-like domain-containing protein n=1 Tax=Rheinheimera salexigens TaxID=1628148 RepID=A0A1E7Q2H9_9GAMM|nr:Ig-like domain-containing protein [Rheinheimera salexigens]OEY68320.1 hypothetical protein BI198_01120 [Rheinheimera salexigens]